MNKREPLMSAEYFDADIALVSQAVQRVTREMASYQDKAGAQFDLIQYLNSLLISHYSRGYPLAQLKTDLLAVLDAWEIQRALDSRQLYTNSFEEDLSNYVNSLGLLSQAYLLRLPAETLNRLLVCIGNAGQDLLFERFAAAISPGAGRPQAKKLLYPKAYQLLYNAMEAPPAEQAGLVQQFLKDWYRRLKNASWHDAHKGPEGGGFVGYWCWEAAGVARAFGIDDRSFRDMPYYPKDLADFARTASPA